MTLPVHTAPPPDEPTKQEQPAERIAMMKRRGLFAAVAALVAGVIAKPQEVAATAGLGADVTSCWGRISKIVSTRPPPSLS